ncbi:hypothetical protein SODALDRAFT_319286 [Sodiomyces alkalinus F11]|uniref:Uncharacterized protein n=1 Tax=Sodiomyces alkalinus (strain CBS 110278 / VKM F-3762 / F11) TaxID=1314773 RepID=A0A3N2Q7E3_SODAK|nr:hypothetical protein SODALDRAFT_319286 [Sodiomyces alkalinus F11]ROT42662.1 hypothetical protein SODALDRAFT_319286 [Sodiomyces alkalinus F11]
MASAAVANPGPGVLSGAPPSSSPSSSTQPLARSSSSSSSPKSLSRTLTAKSVTDPILRNALRYTISAREYAILHKYILSRPRVLRRAAPSVATVERIIEGSDGRGKKGQPAAVDNAGGSGGGNGSGNGDSYNTRAVRESLRVFLGTAGAMKTFEALASRVAGKKEPNTSSKKQPLHKSSTFRLSLSLSTILLLYRVLFRFLTRLRMHLLDDAARPFRLRNPRAAATLTSPFAPAVGASLAGLALGIYPAQKLRVSVAVFALFRALEFAWNLCEGEGLVWGWKNGGRLKRERPWWWGSWLLQPFALGQLFHAFVFDRDCFPEPIGKFIVGGSTAYLHPRPEGYPSHITWPSAYDIVDSLARMARLDWPPYISPTLFPDKETLPLSLSAVRPLTSLAHPIITSLSCATLHPSDPSCLRTYLQFWLGSFPPLARLFLGLYAALALLPGGGRKLFYHAPLATLQGVLARALRTSSFLAGALSTAWASVCFFQQWFPRHFLPRLRFFLGGFAAGLWAWADRRRGRAAFLYSARASVDSLWKVGVKRRWWRGMKGGDVWVFVAALIVTGVVYERDAGAMREAGWRKGVSWVRGTGFRDWSIEEDEVEGERDEEEDEEFEPKE